LSLVLGGLTALTLVAGCTNTTGGVATPGSTESATDSSTEPPESGMPSSTGASPTTEIPPRPRELKLDGIKPCSLFTPAQLAQLRNEFQLDREPRPYTTGDYFKAPACDLEQSREPFNTFALMLITTEGIEPWLSGKRNVDAWLTSVGGYPAAGYKLAGSDDDECAIAVDVAEGQQMTVDFMPFERKDYRELCQMTERVAGMALQTLQTLR
jgi:hypothetical protein